MNSLPLEAVATQQALVLACELDEQWSYVGKKSEPRWLWYALSPQVKRVLAYAFGWRTYETLRVC